MLATQEIKIEKKEKGNWEVMKLDDLLDYIQPGPYIVESTDYSDNFKTPVLTAGKSFILGKTNEANGIFNALPVIIFDDFTTATKFVDFKFKVKSSAMKILKPKNASVNLKFVYYYMQTVRVNFDTHKRYWISEFSQLPIKVPSPKEQNLIVEKIEELFSELDYAISTLKTAKQQLQTYRQSVLKYAFEGYFTGGSKDWRLDRIGNVLDFINNGYTPSPSKMSEKGDVQFLKVYNLNFDGTLNYKKNPVFISKEVHENELKRSRTYPNDVLINIVGPPLGKVSIVPPIASEFNINQAIVLFRPNGKAIPQFLRYFLQSPQVIHWLEGTSKATAGQYNVKVSTCREIMFPDIDPTLQEKIVNEIETRLSESDYLLQTINQQLIHAESLRQSILQRAFSGELVKEEPIQIAVEKKATIIPVKPIEINTKIKKVKKITATLSTTDLHAGIIAKVIKLHNENAKYIHTLSHVKCEKIAHLCEAHLEIELGRNPVKDAAGPDDFPHLKKVESRARKANWFKLEKNAGEIGYHYIGLNGLSKSIEKTEIALSNKINSVNELIKLFLPFDKERAEVVATVYAAWNNLLLDGKIPSDEEIIFEARENWSKEKMKIERENFFKTLNWMREKEFVPKGMGKYVHASKKQKKK